MVFKDCFVQLCRPRNDRTLNTIQFKSQNRHTFLAMSLLRSKATKQSVNNCLRRLVDQHGLQFIVFLSSSFRFNRVFLPISQVWFKIKPSISHYFWRLSIGIILIPRVASTTFSISTGKFEEKMCVDLKDSASSQILSRVILIETIFPGSMLTLFCLSTFSALFL